MRVALAVLVAFVAMVEGFFAVVGGRMGEAGILRGLVVIDMRVLVAFVRVARKGFGRGDGGSNRFGR